MADSAALLRHSIRGTINALKLGVSAMDTGLTRDEAIEFLDYIVQASEKMSTLLDQYDALPDEMRVNNPPPMMPLGTDCVSGQ